MAGGFQIEIPVSFKNRVGWDLEGPPMPKRLNETFGKKPPAPSVKVRLGRTPLEQRSGSEPLAPLARRRPPVRNDTDKAETDRRPKPVSTRLARA